MNYFTELNIQSKISKKILDKIDHIDESEWIHYLEQTIYLLKIEDFKDDPDKVVASFTLANGSQLGSSQGNTLFFF